MINIKFILILSLLLSLSGCGNSGNLTPSVKLRNTSKTMNNSLKINEVLTANANTNYDPDFKEFSDWIEIYNDSNKSIDLSNYFLSDTQKHLDKWRFPLNTTIKPYSYLLIWADGKNIKKDALHTNFKLSQKGERVILSDLNGKIIDFIEFSNQESDISCANVDGEIIYMTPTPKAKNSKFHDILERSKKPTFSLKSGFYKGEQIIELQANGDIYYTLDGSHPTALSTPYNSPIIIDKTTVIRAISIEDGKFSSLPLSQTYLIDENITLPVMSISIDESYLYDDEIGIYKNFNEDWERAGNVEFIKDGESKFSQAVGIRIHGGLSRTFPIKSFSIYAKNKYGKSSIKYPIFIDKPTITDNKSFILRNSGNDWQYTLIRDALSHSLAKEIGNISYQSYEPTITFVNGKYFGILNIREKVNKDYIKSNFDVDKNDINLFVENKSVYPSHENNKIVKNLLKFIEKHSLSDENNYKYISSNVDIDGLINYMILEAYIGNYDSMDNNTKYWNSKYTNSKFKWLLYDTDLGYGHIRRINITNVYFNMTDYLISKEDSFTSKVFRSLLQNQNFKNRFLTRYNNLLNTVFLPENINNKITKLKNQIAPEIPRHLKKWFGDERTVEEWEDDIQKLYDYSNQRNEIVREQLEEFELFN